MTEPEQLRFSARDFVLFNPKISAGACRLYMALDSMSGPKGHCWPNQIVLAKRLGTTDRNLRLYLQELRSLVTMIHRRGANVYVLQWAENGKKPILQARNCASDVKQKGRNWGSGDVGTGVPSYSNQVSESENQQARELIEQYPYAKHLPGSPDDGLVQRCLALAGGLDGLCESLHLMFRANRRPDLSWGWFPVAMQSYVRRRA